jgi:hypothetical protein
MPLPARLAPMTHRLRSLGACLLPALLLVACTAAPGASGSPASAGSSNSPSASTSSGSPSASAASPSAAPSDTPGAVGGNPGITPIPAPGDSSAPGGTFPAPSPTEVQPVANLLNVHDVRATAVKATQSGTHLMATVAWWSGPPPCSALSEVKVAQAGTAFTLTVREGAQQLGIACPALATYKQTSVDLGPVSPGTYTVGATGADASVTIILVAG